jgi:hypothetical protein
MSFSNTLENELLEHLLNNANVSDVGDATGLRGSSTAGSFYLSLHTSSPGEAGNQSTNETSYGSYARVSVTRSGTGWTVTGNSASPAANIDFAEATSGTATITHVGLGTDASGTGKLVLYGSLSPSISVTTGVIPRIKTTSTITLD